MTTWILIIPFLTALLAVVAVNPYVFKIAKEKNIVDKPDLRKQQRQPVPLLGGFAIFFGIVCGLIVGRLMYDTGVLYALLIAMIIMLYTGTADDIVGLSPGLRFAVEILLVVGMLFINNFAVNDFHGLFNLTYPLPDWVAIAVTVVGMVGIMNAVNLIDGVDGLASGVCMLSCILFGVFFYNCGDAPDAVMAAACTGALLPFFVHNVFGKESKMYLGDGGTLVMGIVLATFVVNILKHDSLSARAVASGCYGDTPFGLIPFCLAVLSVPVFDTLRVMLLRILRGHSPFYPDRTHIHHLFLRLGFTHVMTTVNVLLLNALVVLAWYLSWRLGAGIDTQFWVVVAAGVLISFCFYWFINEQMRQNGVFYKIFRRYARDSYIERRGIWFRVTRAVDTVMTRQTSTLTEQVSRRAARAAERNRTEHSLEKQAERERRQRSIEKAKKQ